MTNEQKQVRDWMKAFGQETPDKPTIPSVEVRKLRAKLILEEALETIRALGFEICDPSWAYNMKELYDPNLQDIADGCEDLKVVTEGTLAACGLTKDTYAKFSGEDHGLDLQYDPLFNEVMRSNWSKFWTLQERELHWQNETKLLTFTGEFGSYVARDKDGKVIKSPSYSPPNLQSIIESL